MRYTFKNYIRNMIVSVLIILTFSVQLFASGETVTIIKHTAKGDGNLPIDSSAEKFYLGYGDYVTGISGLSSLHHLKTVEIEGTAFLHDFSFLADCRQLKTLVIRECTIDDFDFLSNLAELENLVLQSVRCSSYPDIAGMKCLDYFEMSDSGVIDTCWLEDPPQTVRILNLSYNAIETIDTHKYPYVNKIILTGNPVKRTGLPAKFSTGDDVYTELPEQYRKFVR